MLSNASSRTLLVVAGLVAVGTNVSAQSRWTVDTKYSLAWWQVSPHLNHLWATTCPADPDWRPGEGRSGGWSVKDAPKTKSQTGFQNVRDTVNVPLYPRETPTPVCVEAVSGDVVVADKNSWRIISGSITVKANQLVSGEDRRDSYTRKAILQTDRYPDINFKIDSLVGITKAADTIHATAVGQFTVHGVTKPMNALVRAYPEIGGLRVHSRFKVPVKSLVPEYGFSKFALALGVGTKIWEDLFMGVDLVLRENGAGTD